MWIIVLPETHSSSKVKQGWKEDFQDEVFFFSRKIKFLGCSNSLLWQCHIQKKFGDNIFSRGSGLLSSITAKFYLFILFFTLLATFSCVRCSFEQNTRKLIVYLRNLSDSNIFFLFFIYGDIFGHPCLNATMFSLDMTVAEMMQYLLNLTSDTNCILKKFGVLFF